MKDFSIYKVKSKYTADCLLWRNQVEYWQRINRFKAGEIINKYVKKRFQETNPKEALALSIKGLRHIVFPRERENYTEAVCSYILWELYDSAYKVTLKSL